ncbi:winged helix-turn-helix transcriptional regulator [Thermococcus sp. MV5]|uniref:helix-turn-helix domain-containing protein n=1 Tax=Thermococcus sp. MV5 TaxID=1638272 RepID=UPI00143A3C81|nr:helix-turn-helix domain-containing protein [Thermococcus sp. MV5]NJE25359.1 winged helix-turn-helix transcriptional regulator [Thermococcus sp. MV5]
MKLMQILEILKNEEATVEEIANRTGMNIPQVKRLLLRLLSQGKIESLEKNGKLVWKAKEKDEAEEKFKYI